MRKTIKKKKKSKIPSLSLYVSFSIAMLLIYTVAELTLSALTSNQNDTLTTCFFATFGGEILTCAIIKIFKLKEGENNE